ncbi:O-acyltransferase WSD1-like [Chenopodium quinoa]|uniref:O-acyltransferase WSD1-like n=1 Tax=Chenopodium quinoa TaxID=63459 RepID=UPI000B790E43|nr:O-acyltransferase WSD1-like [Chenopodium quinoa]
MEKNLKVKTKANLEKTSSKLDELEPASPTSEYFLSEVATVYILSIFELEIPIDTSCVYAFFNGVFLNSHPRFSCIPIKGEKGRNMWKKVEVNVEDHIIKGPILPEGLTTEIYSKHLDDYMSKIATTPFQLNKPLWEVHTFNYPTNNATSTLFVKFHHAVGDGISLMGVVFTCLRRVDDPTLPLTFPTKTSNNTSREKQRAIHNVMKTLSVVPRFLSSIFTSVYDFGQTLGVVLFEDECTPIRSGNTNMLLPSLARVCSVTLPLSDVKRIKSLLRATVNDVIIGIISFATQLYIQEIDQRRSNNSGMTASIALNTRSIKGYANPEKMRKGKTWGNRISVIELSLPKYKEEDLKNPLNFIMKVQKLMKRKRKSIGAIYLTAWTLDAIKIFGGFKAAARAFEKSWKNSTFAITNLIGPTQHASIADHPIKGFYFVPTRLNLSLTVSVMSYMDNLRIGLVVENGFIDHQRLITCMENAYQLILQAATSSTKPTAR